LKAVEENGSDMSGVKRKSISMENREEWEIDEAINSIPGAQSRLIAASAENLEVLAGEVLQALPENSKLTLERLVPVLQEYREVTYPAPTGFTRVCT
jgi:hypothetical protein